VVHATHTQKKGGVKNMRIEIDEQLEKLLDKIRSENSWACTGKGHSDTVRFLARYYRENKDVVKIVEEAFGKIGDIIAACFNNALRETILNLLPKDIRARVDIQKKKDGSQP
jgi:hypothetical protein